MSFKESLSELKDIDFADLDIQQIGVWPAALKTILVASIVLLIIGLGYFLKVKDISLLTERAVAQERELLPRSVSCCSNTRVKPFWPLIWMLTANR